jgi:hypothetical protein
MDTDTITISMPRDAAHYVSMLLADQLFSFAEIVTSEHFLPIRRAYEHVNEEIERALAMRLEGPRSPEPEALEDHRQDADPARWSSDHHQRAEAA